MRSWDAAGAIALIAAVALWMSLTDGMLRYLRPAMRPWLIASGLALAVLAIGVALAAWRDARHDGDDAGEPCEIGHRHHRPTLVGWLLVVPFLAAWCVDPGALGAFAAKRQTSYFIPTTTFDLPSYVASHSFGGQDVELQVHEFVLSATADDEAARDLLAETPVRLRGFVVPEPDTQDFLLVRFIMGCCAGDAMPMEVRVHGYEGPVFEEEEWVEVTGTYSPGAPGSRTGDEPGAGVPTLTADEVRQIDPLPSPYEFPR